MIQFLTQFSISKSSEERSEHADWQDHVADLSGSDALVWALQECLQLTDLLDLTTRTTAELPTDIVQSISNPLFVISSPTKSLLEQCKSMYALLDHIEDSYASYTKAWKWVAYNKENPPKTDSSKGQIDVEELIPLSLSNTNIQWLDPEWHATLLELTIQYNGGEHTRAIIILHCAHTDAAKIFEVATPTAAILNGLTEDSDPHPYRKDGAILNAVTKLNPKFVGMDTPEFINDRTHATGSVEWYTTKNGEWVYLS